MVSMSNLDDAEPVPRSNLCIVYTAAFDKTIFVNSGNKNKPPYGFVTVRFFSGEQSQKSNKLVFKNVYLNCHSY